MKHIAAIVLLASFFASAHAQVTVKEAWVRATVPQQSGSGAFLQVTSARDARIVEVRSPVAGVVEMHESRMENNMMKMRPVASVTLPAGKTVEFRPGGYHIMLLGLKGPLKEGQSVPLTLVVERKDGKRENVEVTAAVRPLTAHGGGHGGHH
ncbi:MAG: copper chaperone PCu(A)C [Burkholderiales bacterium]